jgi:phosphate transport system protein
MASIEWRSEHMGSHLEASLQHDIELIRNHVRMMASRCEWALRTAVSTLAERQRQAAYLVILGDQRIDEAEQQLDRLCLEFLVRQQPAGAHLRFAYAAMKISSELERIGDHAEAIARHLLKLDSPQPDVYTAPLQQMADTSIAMLQDAVRAFVTADSDLAHATILVEERVDTMRRSLDADLARLQGSGQLAIEPFDHLTTICRRLERISDEARDICAETLYMCTGDFAKHQTPDVVRVLFVDQHNHCRSRMAEAIATSLALPRMLFSSAGLEPRGIDPRLPAVLAEKGLEILDPRPRSLEQIPNLAVYDVVIAFDESAYYSLRFHRTPTVVIDWSVPDPSKAEGTPDEVHQAYDRTFEFIRTHLQDLVDAIARNE